MSSVLVKKSLEMFKEDFEDEPSTRRKKRHKDPMKLIGTRKKGVKKQLKKLKTKEEMKRHLKLTKKLKKNAVDDVRSYRGGDQTLDNLAYIERLSSLGKAGCQNVSTILQHEKRLAKDKYVPEPKKKQEQSILFCDTAFDMEKTQNEEEDEEFWNS